MFAQGGHRHRPVKNMKMINMGIMAIMQAVSCKGMLAVAFDVENWNLYSP